MNLSFRNLLVLGVAAELLILGGSYLLFPTPEETFRHAARYSGRLSLGIFLYAFFLFATTFPKPVAENLPLRNQLKLFAVLHLIHFVFLALNVYLNAIPMVPVKLTGGALAYTMIVIAPFQLHRIRPALQLVFFYYVSLVMMITYVARIKGDFEGAEPFWFHYVALGGLGVASIAFGILMQQASRRGLTNE